MTERRSRTSSTVVASLLTKLSTLPVPCPPPQYGQDPGWNMQGDPWHMPVSRLHRRCVFYIEAILKALQDVMLGLMFEIAT